MARLFDGVNDNLTTPDNTVSGLDANDFSVAAWVQQTSQGASNQVILATITQAGGANRHVIRTAPPATSGWRLQFGYVWTGGNAIWQTDADLTLGIPYHIAVTYNRSSTSNDPVIYVNGTAVAFTETSSPSGSANTGSDTLRIGESATNGGDWDGLMSHLWMQGGIIIDAAAVNRAKWWGRPQGGGHIYYPFITDKLTNEGSETGATLTATGSVMGSFSTPVVRPGHMLMGMKAGW